MQVSKQFGVKVNIHSVLSWIWAEKDFDADMQVLITKEIKHRHPKVQRRFCEPTQCQFLTHLKQPFGCSDVEKVMQSAGDR